MWTRNIVLNRKDGAFLLFKSLMDAVEECWKCSDGIGYSSIIIPLANGENEKITIRPHYVPPTHADRIGFSVIKFTF